MRNRKNRLFFFSLIICFFTLVVGFDLLGNISSKNLTLANVTGKLTVSAAASLKDVMEEIKPLYEQKYSQTKLTYNFGSSGSLQQQIEQGAPVDIFISAANKQMDALEKKGLLLTGTRRNLVSNQMVLIVPANQNQNKVQIKNFTDLTNKNIGRIALGEPKSVPAGKYAQEVLTYYKIAEQVNAKAVYGKDVRQVLNYVATGNVDAGIVYLTDAKIENKVKIVATAPSSSHSPVVYPIAVIKDSKNPQESKQLINFLTTSDIQKIFKKYGFS
ncbi:molybdate ABC transporter substrate-binding protein [Cyanobacterium sp. Dongsha4]|uniref:molybdate ABC transporter substrate-binding protein n=1 Tax=Cyanobacterium sp. DS4 TaxID=2878255 RepID=UPI002E81D3F3|nr:molybdate ABC transporter substrate-binding protein [Cyanobacterium sp. Dongsha4]WVL00201.1 molybdate ABC transporter substrate-binding protein [Cyanobacterium sp. Dongsha4]